MLQKVNQEERLRLAYGSPDHSSAYMNVDSQYSDEHDKLPAIDKKLQSKIPLQEIVPSSVLSSNDTHIDQSGSVGECSSPPSGPMDSGCCCKDPELKLEDAKDGIIALINQIQ